MNSTWIVIPALNAGESIGVVLDSILPHYPMKQVVVVDDGSTDDTAARAAERGVAVERHERNRGVGAAVKTGVERAIHGGADAIVTIGADRQRDPADIRRLVERLEADGADLVIGSRFLQPNPGMPPGRRRANRVITGLVNLLFRTRFSDCLSGFRAFTPAVAPLLGDLPDGYAFDANFYVACASRGLRISEAGVSVYYPSGSTRMTSPWATALSIIGSLLARWTALPGVALLFPAAATLVSVRLINDGVCSDTMRQIAAALNLLNGPGLGWLVPNVADLSQPLFARMIQWPAGYSLMIAPLLGAGLSTEAAQLVLDIAGVAAFYFSWHWILNKGGVSRAAQALVWCSWIVINPVFRLGGPTDVLCAGLMGVAIALTLALQQGENSAARGRWLAAGAGLLIGATCWLRYAYWMLAPVLPLFLLLARRRRLAAWMGGAIAAALLLLVLFNETTAGQATYLPTYYPGERNKGFFFFHLLRFRPFPADGIGLSRVVGGAVALWSVSAVILGLYAAHVRREIGRSALSGVAGIGVLVLAFLTGGLSWLSLRHWHGGVTFVETARYYIPLYPFLLLGVASLATQPGRWLKAAAIVVYAAAVLGAPENLADLRKGRRGRDVDQLRLVRFLRQPDTVFMIVSTSRPSRLFCEISQGYFAGAPSGALRARTRALSTGKTVRLVLGMHAGVEATAAGRRASAFLRAHGSLPAFRRGNVWYHETTLPPGRYELR